MKDFSWKQIGTYCAIALGGGLVSFMLSGLLPVAVMPLKILLFFVSIATVIFATSTVTVGGIMQSRQQNKDFSQDFEREDNDLSSQLLDEEVQRQIDLEKARQEREDTYSTYNSTVKAEQTPLDETFEMLAKNTQAMKQSKDAQYATDNVSKNTQVEDENSEKSDQKGLEI